MTTTRLTAPSFRTRCPKGPGLSTNVPPTGTTSGVQVGSSPSYFVAAPDKTITKQGPGWVCQPNVPPGTTVFFTILRSEDPLVSMFNFQSPVLMCTSISGKAPLAMSSVVTPDGGVASA